MLSQVLEVWLCRCAPDLMLYITRERGGMHQIAFNFVSLPPQPLESLTCNGGGLNLLTRVAVDELQPWQVVPDQFQRVVVVLRRNTRGAGSCLRHCRLPKQVRRERLVHRMVEHPCPLRSEEHTSELQS